MVVNDDDSARASTIYRVCSRRRSGGGWQTSTHLRRQLPAARRLARELEQLGRGPVRIEVARAEWREVTS